MSYYVIIFHTARPVTANERQPKLVATDDWPGSLQRIRGYFTFYVVK